MPSMLGNAPQSDSLANETPRFWAKEVIPFPVALTAFLKLEDKLSLESMLKNLVYWKKPDMLVKLLAVKVLSPVTVLKSQLPKKLLVL